MARLIKKDVIPDYHNYGFPSPLAAGHHFYFP